MSETTTNTNLVDPVSNQQVNECSFKADANHTQPKVPRRRVRKPNKPDDGGQPSESTRTTVPPLSDGTPLEEGRKGSAKSPAKMRRKPRGGPAEMTGQKKNSAVPEVNSPDVPGQKEAKTRNRRPGGQLGEARRKNAGPKSRPRYKGRNKTGPPLSYPTGGHSSDGSDDEHQTEAAVNKFLGSKSVDTSKYSSFEPSRAEYSWDREYRILCNLFQSNLVTDNVDTIAISCVLKPTDPEIPTEALFPEGLRFHVEVNSIYKTAGETRDFKFAVTDDHIDPWIRRTLKSWSDEQWAESSKAEKPLYHFVKNLDRNLYDLLIRAAESKSSSVLREGEWDAHEQKRLEDALVWYRSYKDPKVKWRRIAEFVKTRTAKQCFLRFQECCCQVKQQEECNQDKSQSSDEHQSSLEGDLNESEELEEEEELEQEATPLAFDSNTSTVNSKTPAGQSLVPISVEATNISYFYCAQLQCVVACGKCCKRLPVDICPTRPNERGQAQVGQVDCTSCHRTYRIEAIGLYSIPKHDTSPCARLIIYGASVIDILPSDYLVVCSCCGASIRYVRMYMNVLKSQFCRHCHTKTQLSIQHMSIVGSQPPIETKQAVERKPKRAQDAIKFVVGQPLPKNGACSHYKKSFRWFRFPCCQRAFPCDKCHDRSSDHKTDDGLANRIICGFCSREQNAQNKECPYCKSTYTAAATTHWEGGGGCRDWTKMSRRDPRKFKLMNKELQRCKAAATNSSSHK